MTTRYEDGTEECIISADDGIEPSSCVTYPDGTMIESGGGESYITIIYPDESVKIIRNDGITDYWDSDGRFLYCVERIEHARFGLVFYLRYHHDNDFTAVICNSDGSPNRFSGQTYQRGSLSFGGWGRCFNLFDEDGVHHHIPVDDGPFYDY